MIEYKNAYITWHDDDYGEMFVNVAITPNWQEDDYDDRIFYYFVSNEEFEQAKQPEPNGFEFTIREEN
jgi:hypothetical protein